jgi:hypothetical protein
VPNVALKQHLQRQPLRYAWQHSCGPGPEFHPAAHPDWPRRSSREQWNQNILVGGVRQSAITQLIEDVAFGGRNIANRQLLRGEGPWISLSVPQSHVANPKLDRKRANMKAKIRDDLMIIASCRCFGQNCYAILNEL